MSDPLKDVAEALADTTEVRWAMKWLHKVAAWFKPRKVERYGPDHMAEDEEGKPAPKQKWYTVYHPGPTFPSMVNHPFMARMKATRLQTLGQKNLRGSYIIETDPPSEEAIIRHMHSTARWMAMARVTE